MKLRMKLRHWILTKGFCCFDVDNWSYRKIRFVATLIGYMKKYDVLWAYYTLYLNSGKRGSLSVDESKFIDLLVKMDRYNRELLNTKRWVEGIMRHIHSMGKKSKEYMEKNHKVLYADVLNKAGCEPSEWGWSGDNTCSVQFETEGNDRRDVPYTFTFEMSFNVDSARDCGGDVLHWRIVVNGRTASKTPNERIGVFLDYSSFLSLVRLSVRELVENEIFTRLQLSRAGLFSADEVRALLSAHYGIK